MVQSEMDFGGDELELRAKVVLNLQEAKRQLQELGGNISGGAANLAGQAGAAMGIGGRGANADAEPTRTKEQDERAKVRTTALQTLAKSAPGGGLMSSMASSFKGGGIMAGMATGITAVVGILTSIMKSSQVFQTMAGTIFKILGMMADLFLMPFVPLMMKFASWMIQHMPQIQEAGQKVADFTEKLVSIFTWGSKQEKAGKERQEQGGLWNKIAGGAQEGLGRGLSPGGIFRMGPLGGASLLGKLGQFGNSEASGGPRMAMGVGGGDTAGGSINFSDKVADWIKRFQQKEMGPGGVMERWYDQMFGGSIMPDIWGNIRGFFGDIETETGSISSRVTSDSDELEADRKGFWSKLKFWEYIPEIWGKIKDFFADIAKKLLEFFTFDIPLIDLGDSAATVAACFGRAKNAVVNFFTNTIPNAARKAAEGIAGAAVWVWGSAGTVISIIGSAFALAGQAVWHFFSSILPGWAVSAGKAIAGAAVWVWGGISWVAEKIWAGLKIAGEAIWHFFTEIIPNWAGQAAGAIAAAAVWVWGGVSAIAGFIWDKLKLAAGAVKGFFTDTLPGWAYDAYIAVWGAVQSIASFVTGIAGLIGRYLGYALSSVKEFFTDTLPGWAYDAYLAIWGAVQGIASFVSGIGSLIGRYIGYAVSAVKTFFTETLTGWAYDGYLKTFNAIQGVGSIVWTALGNIGNYVRWAKDAVANFIKGLWDDIKSVPGKVGGWLNPFDQFGNTSSNSGLYQFGNSVGSAGTMHAFGSGGGGPRRVMPMPPGMMSGNGGVTSNRVVNVNITSSLSIHDIVRDVERLDSIQEAAFFNTV